MPDDDRSAWPQEIAVELAGLGPMEVVWRPISVLQLTGLVQLALRHPGLATDTESRHTADKFLHAVREYFADCPTTLALIAAGDDPAQDLPWEQRPVN